MRTTPPTLGQVTVVNPALYIEKPPRAFTHNGLEWAVANAKVGEQTSNFLLVSAICELLKNYFHAFISDGSNVFVNLVTYVFGAVADFFQGMRDKEMYNKVYATGVSLADGSKLDQDILTEPLLLQQANPIADDYEENSTGFKDDSVIHKLWVWSAKSANLKPLLYPLFPLLGMRLANVGKIVLDSIAKILWRARFLNNGLYSNASRDLYELTTSLFNSSSKEKKVKELESLARSYFQNSDISSEKKKKYLQKSGISLYFAMLCHMLTKHFRDIKYPMQALETKCSNDYLDETTEEERTHDPSRTFGRGFVDRTSKNDQYFQRISSIADFVGPVSGALGIAATLVFDSLKGVIELAGINYGRRVVDAISSSKKGLSMIYYFFKIMLPEITQSNCEPLEGLIKNGTATEATKLLYTLRKDRNRNAHMMILTGLVNIMEPFLYMSSSVGRGLNFVKGLFYDFGTTFLLLGFSKRRECMGKIRYLYTVVSDVLGKENSDLVSADDFQKVDNRQLEDAMQAKAPLHLERGQPGILERINLTIRNLKGGLGYGDDISGLLPRVKAV